MLKKMLSVFLAALMLFSCFALTFGVFAADRQKECTCEDCTKIPNGCHCCVYCPYLDKTYLTSCVKDENGNFVESFCCSECTGIWPCHCGHECCDPYEEPTTDTNGPILTPDQQQTFIQGFQKVMDIIRKVFDGLFNALFDFLRIRDLFPDIQW